MTALLSTDFPYLTEAPYDPMPDDDYGQMLDEHAVAERHGLLGGKSLINSNGKLEKFKYLLTSAEAILSKLS